MQTETIAPEMQADVIGFYWTMLRELESAAENDRADVILKHWVECGYRQWNKMTGDDKKARWE